MKSITELLGIQYPIFQGAMAQISKYQLAAAVSNAGGLGIIASGGMSAEQLKGEIQNCKKLTNKPFAVNLMLMAPNVPELIQVIVDEGVSIVTTGAGTPKKYMPIFDEADIKVIPVVPSAVIAKKMEDIGATAVVAEGSEAGGHIGELSTMVLLPQVVEAVSIPVIAAGGIGTGKTMAAAYVLGASGVQMGTAFMLAEECPIPANVKDFIANAKEMDTAVTGRNGGAPVRSLKNKMIEQYIQWEKDNMPREQLEELTMGSARKAAAGDIENGSVMAGQVSGLLHQVKPAKQLIEDVLSEARTAIKNVEVNF
ncbi:nitronate monooxygenase [Enterococcus quebecensis]|uniref:Probable nitronate monooxygenase n=1 Tax=Enterococcus quebecensis TaxID=903983 RepID=A0A1E5GRF3_9ENTE|nr:nitronate monooxygenase [Enterococcus quebecensis]OEG15318.1 2-nitropropane dioxygenase [Enterococcus quebecensis]OJG72281.1 2-nitropropane dioxygenase family protein [Enterococcus quebecensis]